MARKKQEKQGNETSKKRTTKKIAQPQAQPVEKPGFEVVADEFPIAPFTGRLDLAGHEVVPPGIDRDRSKPDRDRWKERNRRKIDKGDILDIIGRGPVIGGGKIRVPVKGDTEPVWRPGRDGQGGGGGGDGDGDGDPDQEAGDQPGGDSYEEWDAKDIAKEFFDALNLPFMFPKDRKSTFTKTYRTRGSTLLGSPIRLLEERSVEEYVDRCVAQINASPEEYIADYAQKCQSAFERFLYWSAQRQGIDPENAYALKYKEEESNEALEFFSKICDAAATVFYVEGFNELVTAQSEAYLLNPEEYLLGADVNALEVEQVSSKLATSLPYNFNASIKDVIEEYVKDDARTSIDQSALDEISMEYQDFRYRAMDELKEPNSKCVVYLVLDRSGSMGGDPIKLAKVFFFLVLIYLQATYEKVEVVLISHDAQAYLWKKEEDFFRIGAGGGTVAEPAWELVAELYKKYGSSWNHYMFHATDGDLFDGDEVIRRHWTKLVKELNFSYLGYLEIPAYGWGGWGGVGYWSLGGRALLGLPAEIKAHIGMARTNSLDGLADAFREMLEKDANKQASS